MTTFAHITAGFTTDIQIADTAAELAARFHPDWLAKNPFIIVPDGTLHNAKDNGDGTFENPPAEPDPETIPHTPGNPYFGKLIKSPDEFYGLIGQILPPARYKRLRNDAAFLWIQDMIQSPTFRVVDPDDKQGLFVRIVGYQGIEGYLTQTLGEDGQPLMTKNERDTIMQAWK